MFILIVKPEETILIEEKKVSEREKELNQKQVVKDLARFGVDLVGSDKSYFIGLLIKF